MRRYWTAPATKRASRYPRYRIIKERYPVAINIKNPETEALIRSTVAITHETQDRAVAIAMRERLARLGGDEKAAIVRRISKQCAPLLGDRRDIDHDAMLYDETGLTR